MVSRNTPPCSEPSTPNAVTRKLPHSSAPSEPATPTSISTTSPGSASSLDPESLTQALVEPDLRLRRFQKDLLVLTGFNENETLHWRPSWFIQDPFATRFWTLQNPPDVVTEKLPIAGPRGKQYYTRRMRKPADPEPYYIKSWGHWRRYCDMYGIPYDFLCEKQIEIMRLGLPRTEERVLCPPPSYPLYPEPQPLGHGRYILDPFTYFSHLLPKFHLVKHTADVQSELEAVVVHSTGALKVEPRENMFSHHSQWTHFDGTGGYIQDTVHSFDELAPKEQGLGRRWSYAPWTSEQEESCKRATLMVKLKYKRKHGDAGKESNWGEDMKKGKKKQKRSMLLAGLK
ncbi:hypothetical protein EJ02DRAFT_229007 [Clathrospora elynae]|uniref:Uncharacterized protein n=1 Tax=Clathrospora elynae TaxID=706981 RepID=A0A6A5SIM4_9PLEO|nr:hypothetical protein EJ02DRAFT_229007 [Clathrospora elynae]